MRNIDSASMILKAYSITNPLNMFEFKLLKLTLKNDEIVKLSVGDGLQFFLEKAPIVYMDLFYAL